MDVQIHPVRRGGGKSYAQLLSPWVRNVLFLNSKNFKCLQVINLIKMLQNDDGPSLARIKPEVQNNFLGLKFTIFWGKKILASIFLCSLISVGIFGGVFKKWEDSL